MAINKNTYIRDLFKKHSIYYNNNPDEFKGESVYKNLMKEMIENEETYNNILEYINDKDMDINININSNNKNYNLTIILYTYSHHPKISYLFRELLQREDLDLNKKYDTFSNRCLLMEICGALYEYFDESEYNELKFENLELILSHPNIDYNITDIDNHNPLMWLCISENTRSSVFILEQLFKYGNYDLNQQDYSEGFTALISLFSTTEVNKWTVDMLKLLLNQPGIDLNKTDYDDYTALSYILYYGNLENKNYIESLNLILKHPDLDINNLNSIYLINANIKGIAYNRIEKTKALLRHPKIDYNVEYNGEPVIELLFPKLKEKNEKEKRYYINKWIGDMWVSRNKMIKNRFVFRSNIGLSM
jgi:hypothetical protein